MIRIFNPSHDLKDYTSKEETQIDSIVAELGWINALSGKYYSLKEKYTKRLNAILRGVVMDENKADPIGETPRKRALRKEKELKDAFDVSAYKYIDHIVKKSLQRKNKDLLGIYEESFSMTGHWVDSVYLKQMAQDERKQPSFHEFEKSFLEEIRASIASQQEELAFLSKFEQQIFDLEIYMEKQEESRSPYLLISSFIEWLRGSGVEISMVDEDLFHRTRTKMEKEEQEFKDIYGNTEIAFPWKEHENMSILEEFKWRIELWLIECSTCEMGVIVDLALEKIWKKRPLLLDRDDEKQFLKYAEKIAREIEKNDQWGAKDVVYPPKKWGNDTGINEIEFPSS